MRAASLKLSALGLGTIFTTGTGNLIRLALDTNILVYAEGLPRTSDDKAKIDVAKRVLVKLRDIDSSPVIALQALAELHRVLVRKESLSPGAAASIVRLWMSTSELVGTEEAIFAAALDLASEHHVQTYDALILTAAVYARCDLLLSEDMKNGFAWRGVTVANPFAQKLEPRLAKLLS